MKWTKITAWSELVLGVVHCLATPMIMKMGFGALPTPMRHAFLFVFLGTGVPLIVLGFLQLKAIPYIAAGHPLAILLRNLNAIFLFVLGGGAVAAMFDNPFAYLTLITGVLAIVGTRQKR